MKFIKQNYHAHTTYSDGKESISEYIKEAIAKGFLKIGISDHSPVPFESSWNMREEDLVNYSNDLTSVKREMSCNNQEIEIVFGLEVDYIPNIQSSKNFYQFYQNKGISAIDYTIGSVHYLCESEDGAWWNFDSSSEKFKQGMVKYYGNDIRSVVMRYYDMIRTMLENDPPEILGHFDLIKKFNRELSLFDETDEWYQKEVDKTLECLKNTKTILEVNTSYIYRKGESEPYPSREILKKVLERKIPVIVNSDSHAVSHIESGMRESIGIMTNLEERSSILFRQMTYSREVGSFIEH